MSSLDLILNPTKETINPRKSNQLYICVSRPHSLEKNDGKIIVENQNNFKKQENDSN